jgi:polysaccharide export outer membrane protein
VTVAGDVRQPGRVELDADGLTLVEAVALSGGATGPDHETEVSVFRGARVFRLRLSDDALRLGGGGQLEPGDRVELRHKARHFAVFGALGDSRLFPFETEAVTLAEAMARARGLRDAEADPGAVFLFRYESAARLARVGVDPLPPAEPEGYPTIYHLDLSDPAAFFLARSLRIEDKDIIYVADAPAAEFRQFIGTLVSPFFGGVQSAQRATE